MCELIALIYSSAERNMGKQSFRIYGLIELLASVGTKVPEELVVASLVSSVSDPQLNPVCAASMTLALGSVPWDTVSHYSLYKTHYLSNIWTERINSARSKVWYIQENLPLYK